jgi:hypothetical protein
MVSQTRQHCDSLQRDVIRVTSTLNVGIITGDIDGQQICWNMTSRETKRKYSTRVSGMFKRENGVENKYWPLLFIEETISLTSQGIRMNVQPSTVTICFNTWYDF